MTPEAILFMVLGCGLILGVNIWAIVRTLRSTGTTAADSDEPVPPNATE
jgi:hypothetical protein